MFRCLVQKGLSYTRFAQSPTQRIIIGNSLFALAHAINLLPAQVFHIFLNPTESILYETTGSLIAPIAAHVTFNAIQIPRDKVLVIAYETFQKVIQFLGF